ncbi:MULTISPECIES: hypothetical protein [unclassified Geobacillus]|uniref:hypothetical protein n=1 Tax=unclassified Geobacillus TaxID=2642459 RepID=UPI000BE31483|nr:MULTISPECIES: hypothetical protein [unclassified Geobacillus]PDM40527.1 hypothetical protein CN643_08710 [Parageobacillus yumthangensis]RDV21430.1 hypothetical protein DXK91_14225 [Parageobacillus toebii]TXK86308.1 hypothetical protein FVE24_19140 [Parageobacillus sp. SY1]PUF89143.1 hypothetical protein DCC82_08940 [Geobacillus sp. LYN3]TXK87097.1 hypothetical protein FVE68_11390 [Geobacillus sp. AYS3]
MNIKFYTKNERLLDINPNGLPDYYLLLTGDLRSAASSRGWTRPWCISYVYLFEASALLEQLKARNVKIGIATSVAGRYWEDAEIFPSSKNPIYTLTNEQKEWLELFSLQR